ncbi:MAG TPA: cytidylate kinase-like family protein [Jatrophihabitans sp.]|jgi:cytidylate kinase
MPGVTITAGYGAGGSVVAPALAKELGVQLLDRAISTTVAAKLQVTVQEAVAGEAKRTFTEKFMSLLAPLAGGVLGAGTDAAPPQDDPVPDEAAGFREQAEAIMRAALPAGAVILGRGGTAALCHEPDVLRVRLFGPVDARIAQATQVEHVDIDTARERLQQVDDARDHYIWRLYKVHASEPWLFHLQIDSTVVPLDTCVSIIATAYRAMLTRVSAR